MKNRYITYREEDEFGRLCFFILQKAHPNFIGLLVASPVEGSLINVPISNYNLWITFNGTIIGNYLPATKGIMAEAYLIFNDMASWYYENRVKGVKKLDKFKIKTNDNIPV